MKKFKIIKSNSHSNNYINILDICCQKDRVVAYVEGTKYITELISYYSAVDK